MAKKGGENSKKAAGQARKADNANKKKQDQAAAAEAAEAATWEDGAKKGNKKKEDAQFKKEEAARKKAERDALLKAEEIANPSKSRGAAKQANKKTNKIDSFLDWNKDYSGIEDGGVQSKDIDRHPERRVKAAFAAYEEKRLPELRKENPGLRLQQVKNILFKEFQKSPENPMNQDTNIDYNASKDEIDAKKKDVRAQREKKFA
ncbi:hypothetical protein QCA50_015630 [Cerrena zonata]|uniref:DUF1014-domain-containing protein n=1 Tax=Cerrena zonata TaxID=2478898 RepID=A0AAW0FUN2_9APHY